MQGLKPTQKRLRTPTLQEFLDRKRPKPTLTLPLHYRGVIPNDVDVDVYTVTECPAWETTPWMTIPQGYPLPTRLFFTRSTMIRVSASFWEGKLRWCQLTVCRSQGNRVLETNYQFYTQDDVFGLRSIDVSLFLSKISFHRLELARIGRTHTSVHRVFGSLLMKLEPGKDGSPSIEYRHSRYWPVRLQFKYFYRWREYIRRVRRAFVRQAVHAHVSEMGVCELIASYL